MFAFLTKLLLVARSRLKSRASLEAENLVLRQQVIVLSRKSRSRVRLPEPRSADLRLAVPILPRDSECDHRSQARNGYPVASARLSGLLALEIAPTRRPPEDRPRDPRLIRRMSKENPLWGAPRIHGELLMLGIEVAQSTVARYMTRRQGPPSQGWKTFLRNHTAGIASIDLFVVRTISFKLLYGLVILRHARRRLVSISVTDNPTAEWIAGQVTDAFPWDEAPRHLIRDRDGAFGPAYTAVFVPWGSEITLQHRARRGRTATSNGSSDRYGANLFDHLIVIGEAHLRGVLKAYASYYNEARTHLSLDKDAPDFRRAQKFGCIAAIPILGGLHHQYVRV